MVDTMSDIKGFCHICGEIAEKVCRMCGKGACGKHIKGGVCASCISGRS